MKTNLKKVNERIRHQRGECPLIVYGKKGEGIHKMEIHGKLFIINNFQQSTNITEPTDIDFEE